MSRLILFLIAAFITLNTYGLEVRSGSGLLSEKTENHNFTLIKAEDYSLFRKKKPKYFTRRKKREISGFITPMISYSNSGEKYQFLSEVHIALTLKDQWQIGGYGASNFILPNLNVEGLDYPARYWHAGGYFGIYGYRFGGTFRHTLFLRGGYGIIDVSEPDEIPVTDNFIAISPGFEIDMSIVHYAHVGFGVKYDIMEMIGNSGYSKKDFSGFSMFIALRLGTIAR